MKEKIKIFLDKIQQAENILIVGHKNPDGDSLCSVLALYALIKNNFGKKAVCLYDGNIPDALDNVPYRDKMQFFEHINQSQKFDLALVLDYGTVVHIGGAMPFVQSASYKIEIDHHKNDDHVADLCLDDETASATGEILFSLMKEIGWKFDKEVADLIALSILTDTGFLKYARSGVALNMMAELVDMGVKIYELEDVLNNKPWKTIKTEAGAVVNAEFFYGKKLAVATIESKDYKNLDGRGETALNLLRQVKGVDFIVLLKEQKSDKIGLSFRSRNKSILHIAEFFGGGGHAKAAGAVVNGRNLSDVKKEVIKIFEGEI